VKLPWRRADESLAESIARPTPESGSDAGQACPSLARVLTKVLKEPRPEILDIGPFCGATAVFLADRGARVSVGELELPLPPSPAEGEPVPPIRLDQPDARYHLVLAWEILDFLPQERLPEFGRELTRILARGGFALFIALADASRRAAAATRPPRYRVMAEDRVAWEPAHGAPLERYVHATREIERRLLPLTVHGIHLQRSQMREVLLYRPMV
jgi:hypothetical protein